jgi:hypothetical protein
MCHLFNVIQHVYHNDYLGSISHKYKQVLRETEILYCHQAISSYHCNELHERKLRSRSRTSEQSFVSVYRVYCVSTDSITYTAVNEDEKSKRRLLPVEFPAVSILYFQYLSRGWYNSCDYSLGQPEFDPRSSHVRFRMDRMALRQVLGEYHGFRCQVLIHQMLLAH